MPKIKGQTITNPEVSKRDSEPGSEKPGIWGKLTALFNRQKTQSTTLKTANSPQGSNPIEKFILKLFRGGSQAKSYVSEQDDTRRNISNINDEIRHGKTEGMLSSKNQALSKPEIKWQQVRKPVQANLPSHDFQLSASRTKPSTSSHGVTGPSAENKLPPLPKELALSEFERSTITFKEIAKHTPDPIYFTEDPPETVDTTDAPDVEQIPEEKYARLDRNRAFVESSAFRFDLDIAEIGTLLRQPVGQFRAPFGLNAIASLSDAFQIYYEEGKKTHENSFSYPDWNFRQISQSPETLKNLLSDLEKIQGTNDQTQKLIEKAKASLQERIDSL